MIPKYLSPFVETSWPFPLDSGPFPCSPNDASHLPLTSHYQICIERLPNFSLKTVAIVFVETLDNLQHSTWLVPESRLVSQRTSFFSFRDNVLNSYETTETLRVAYLNPASIHTWKHRRQVRHVRNVR